jgi:hypothetical protein
MWGGVNKKMRRVVEEKRGVEEDDVAGVVRRR